MPAIHAAKVGNILYYTIFCDSIVYSELVAQEKATISKITVTIDEVIYPELNDTSSADMQAFEWQPQNGFPRQWDTKISSRAYNMSNGGYFFMHFHTETRYDPVILYLDFPTWTQVTGTATVVAQGVHKQFPVSCKGGEHLRLYGAKRVSKITLFIQKLVIPDVQETEDFVWEPDGGFPSTWDRQIFSQWYKTKIGALFWITYYSETRFDVNYFRLELPLWAQAKGIATVVGQGIRKQFPVTGNGAVRVMLGGAKRVSKITLSLASLVVPQINATSTAGAERFVWQPEKQFPPEDDRKVDSQRYSFRVGGSFVIRYSSETRYDSNAFELYLSNQTQRVKGTATVVSQGVSKQFPFAGREHIRLVLGGARKVSQITVDVEEIE